MFILGNRVVCTEEYPGNGSLKGQKGTIIGFQDTHNKEPCVQFDNKIALGHAGSPFPGKYGYCWNFWNHTSNMLVLDKDFKCLTQQERVINKIHYLDNKWETRMKQKGKPIYEPF